MSPFLSVFSHRKGWFIVKLSLVLCWSGRGLQEQALTLFSMWQTPDLWFGSLRWTPESHHRTSAVNGCRAQEEWRSLLSMQIIWKQHSSCPLPSKRLSLKKTDSVNKKEDTEKRQTWRNQKVAIEKHTRMQKNNKKIKMKYFLMGPGSMCSAAKYYRFISECFCIHLLPIFHVMWWIPVLLVISQTFNCFQFPLVHKKILCFHRQFLRCHSGEHEYRLT